MIIYSFHEHELKRDINIAHYELEVAQALDKLKVPGLISAVHLKGQKGERDGHYAVLWTFKNMAAIEANFGTLENPKWPVDWLHYENEVLAQYLTCHPNKIHFTDYGTIKSINY